MGSGERRNVEVFLAVGICVGVVQRRGVLGGHDAAKPVSLDLGHVTYEAQE